MEKIPVLFIAGAGRSGSTLLERMLGQTADLSPIGELRHLGRQDFELDLCGCGQRFQDCPFWAAVFSEAFGKAPNFPDLLTQRNQVDRIRFIPKMLWFSYDSKFGKDKKAYSDVLLAIYQAVLNNSSQKMVLDSSKDVSTLYLLSTMPEIDLHVLHLIRDSRAVAFSWQRQRKKLTTVKRGKYMPVYTARKTAWNWLYRNILAELAKNKVQSYTRVYYEELIQNPTAVLCQIRQRIGLAEPDLGFFVGNSVDLQIDSHTVSGNPMRLKKGVIHLRLDNEWQTRMTNRDKRTVTLLTWPLLKRYGYQI